MLGFYSVEDIREKIINSLIANLGKSEKSPGLSYMVFSRMQKFSKLLIERGLTLDCLTNNILSNKRFKDRVKYEQKLLEVNDKLTTEQYFTMSS